MSASNTQLMLGGKVRRADLEDFHVVVDGVTVFPDKKLELLGVKFDSTFSTFPHGAWVSASARQRAAMIASADTISSTKHLLYSLRLLYLLPFNVTTEKMGFDTDLEGLYPALIECFGIIFIGYLASRFNVISAGDSNGLSIFISTFALPALIFGSLWRLKLEDVHWMFLIAIFSAKSIIFLCVIVATLVVTNPTDYGKAGLFAIFVTQSNDFALGYPILQAVFGKLFPHYPMYVYLIAPISFIFLNPIGFICLEVAKSRRGGKKATTKELSIHVFKAILLNPIIITTVAGMAGSLVFKGNLPKIIDKLLTTLGSAFSGGALFLLGLKLVGKPVRNQQHTTAAIIPIILIALKTLALPILCQELVTLFCNSSNETLPLSNFGFIYGTFPAAPGVFVYATKYQMEVELIASAMVAGTFVAAPAMFVSANLISLTKLDVQSYTQVLHKFICIIGTTSLICLVWVIFNFLFSQKYKRAPHCITMSLLICQLISCIGAILWSEFECPVGWKYNVLFLTLTFGVYGSRMNAALLSLVVLLQTLKTDEWLQNWSKILVVTSVILPASCAMVPLIQAVVEQSGVLEDQIRQRASMYGQTKPTISLLVSFISFLVTILSMILTRRYEEVHRLISVTSENQNEQGVDSQTRLLEISQDGDEFGTLDDTANMGHSFHRNEDTITQRRLTRGDERRLVKCSSCSKAISLVYTEQLKAFHLTLLGEHDCHGTLNTNEIEEEISFPIDDRGNQPDDYRLLLTTLSISMFIGMSLAMWTTFLENISGVYLELTFLDGFLTFGQGILMLAILGFKKNLFQTCTAKLCPRLVQRQLPSQELWSSGRKTKMHCQIFLQHHIVACLEKLFPNDHYDHRFHGYELVDWLIEVGLASDRPAATIYGSHLLQGHVIHQVDHMEGFCDGVLIYGFSSG
eukprot:maker-scaffold1738_size29542-snap-gene-0.9 protein:Tk06061 transcript:maker-scaffold1738_size29542-snap-gene-0.9-mRNA-1 annotation:"hypothetical protein DAPPUDRAFT_312099"